MSTKRFVTPALGSTRTIGLATLIGLAVVLLLLGRKPNIESSMSGGDTITAEFSDSYKLAEFKSTVKLHGLAIGKVYDLDYTDHHTVIAKLRLDDGVLPLLGSKPSASIEQVNVLGGRYSVDLVPGGTRSQRFSGNIPLDRTKLPVELDQIVGAFPETSREGIQGTLRKAAPTLAKSREPLSDSLESLPSFLRPATTTLEAARGLRPGQDLPDLVTNLESTADVVTAKPGQLEQIADDINATAVVLGRRTPELTDVLNDLPETMSKTRRGLSDLSVTVDKLEKASDELRPTAPKLEDLVKELEPTLEVARPVLRDLRPTMRDLRPSVDELVPTTKTATSVLNDLRGPVLNRLKGPVADFVLEPWKGGNAPGFKDLPAYGYQQDHKFYEELAYMATNINRASMTQDSRGSTFAFQAGAGLETLTDGLPGSLPFTPTGILELALRQGGIVDQETINSLIHNLVPHVSVGQTGAN